MTDKYDLSRRKVLAGLGTIGIAGAGAGLGTSAYFSDTESFTNNSLTAGSLDLVVNAQSIYHGADEGLTVGPSGNSEEAEFNFNATDVKPGDWGVVQFCFNIDDNPAYLWANGALVDSNENDFTEPEPTDDGGADGEGELEENTQAVLFYCHPHDLDEEGVPEHALLENEQGLHPGDEGYELEGSLEREEGPVIESGDLESVLEALEGGVQLDGNPLEGDDPDEFPAGEGDWCVCLLLYVPRSVGNIIQTDSVTFDIGFNAVQSRHNPEGYQNASAYNTTSD